MEITRADLLTVGVVAIITAIGLQLWFKPWLTKKYAEMWWHDLSINVAATGLAIILAIAGLFVNNLLGNATDIAFAIIQGVIAAFGAVYGYEVYKNLTKRVANQE